MKRKGTTKTWTTWKTFSPFMAFAMKTPSGIMVFIDSKQAAQYKKAFMAKLKREEALSENH